MNLDVFRCLVYARTYFLYIDRYKNPTCPDTEIVRKRPLQGRRISAVRRTKICGLRPTELSDARIPSDQSKLRADFKQPQSCCSATERLPKTLNQTRNPYKPQTHSEYVDWVVGDLISAVKDRAREFWNTFLSMLEVSYTEE